MAAEQIFNSYNKLYVVVREDLSSGYQIAQAIHAKDLFTHEHSAIETEWYKNSNTIVVLNVKHEKELFFLVDKLKEKSIKYSLFWEPDINEHTALAIQPGEETSLLLKDFRSAGKKCRCYPIYADKE